MPTDWYYSDSQRQRHGPVDAAALRRLHETGALDADALVWRDGWAQWRPWREASAELGLPGPARATFALDPIDSTGPVDPLDAPPPAAEARAPAHWSPYAPPAAIVAADPGVVTGGEVVDAGFWKRYAAYSIDALLVTIVAMGVQLAIAVAMFGTLGSLATPDALFATTGGIVALLLMYLLPIGLQAVYFAWFHAGGAQATLGKMAVGIKVVDEAGGRISFARGIGRYFATVLSWLVLGIGFLMAAFTDRKRALHDMVCSTLVVDRWAYTAHPERQRRELGGVTLAVIILSLLLCVGYLGFAFFLGVMMAGGAR